MKEREAHVFIVWSRGLDQRQKILEDIANRFEILCTKETTWSKGKFSENLSRFYGENLPKNSSKEKHCGTDMFLGIIVKDPNPVYELRETSKGIKPVNINMFDAKQVYRDWTGGGHRIHGSDNIEEAKSNMYLLYGMHYDAALQLNSTEEPTQHHADLIGAHGWESLEQVFNAFNELANYVVLRNYVNIEDELNNLHPDIDVLTDNKRLIADIANGKPNYKDKKRVQHLVMVNGQKVFFDFRFIGDNYYDYKWEQQLLKTRVKYNYLYVPNEENHFYSLMYHAFIHKEKLIEDYVTKLIALSKNVGLDYDETSFLYYGVLKDLNTFIVAQHYDYVEPRDLTVFYNTKVIEPYKNVLVSKNRGKYERVRDLKKLVKKVFRKLGIKIGN